MLGKRGARVERALAQELGSFSADPDLVAQAVLDLVTNAAEAIPEGGRVQLRVARDAGRVRIDVADDGPGVAPEQRAQIFEPFVTTKPRGTGLGLAMALRIAEAHGGTLDLVDGAGAGPHGAGACFRLTLPTKAAA